MLLANFFDEAKNWTTENLPIVIGGAVAIVVLTFLTIYATLRRRPTPAQKLASAAAAAAGASTPKPPTDNSLNWDTPEQSYADRRGSVRREGQPVRVVLSATTFRNGVVDGYVIDRSTGGLKIAAQVAVALGTTLQVKAVDAPDTVGFVTVIVRSCRRHEDHFEFGCEFEKTPPWNVLLLFG